MTFCGDGFIECFMTSALQHAAEEAKSWPFMEARALRDRLRKKPHDDPDRPVLFETGYGPSGLPHIGTFGEVVRTSMVRRAFQLLTGRPTRLICFSDDMDGLRKVPDNVPQAEMLRAHLGKPLTQVPDPFEIYDSFGAHNNERLQSFLNGFGFDYEFVSATKMYKSGEFNDALLHVLRHYQPIKDIVMPTLGEARQETYSPFLPICPTTGKVLQAKVIEHDVEGGTITYLNPETDKQITTLVTDGHCKLQWKVDWAMRWYALHVDYEMSGTDLIESAKLSRRIIQRMEGTPPAGFAYELFLDEHGEKISKSKGNGVAVEEWLKYGSPESLALFMYIHPKRAKRLYFDSIPKTVDDFFAYKAKLPEQGDLKLDNPVWLIERSLITQPEWHLDPKQDTELPVSYALLLNLASVCAAETKETLWGFISNYAPETSPQTHPELDRLAGYALCYYQERVRPTKKYRQATPAEKNLIQRLRDELKTLPRTASAEEIQTIIYSIGKAEYENLRTWFGCLYETMLGQTQGPRMGSFFKLYGLDASIALCDAVLSDQLADF